MRKTFWVSLFKLKIHETNKTLRYLNRNGESDEDIFLNLGNLFRKQSIGIVKDCSTLFVIYLLLYAFGNTSETKVTIAGVSASIPSTFVTLTASVLFFFFVMRLISILQLIFTRTTFGLRMSKHKFDFGSFAFYHGQEDLAQSVPVFYSHFFKSKIPFSNLPLLIIIFPYLALLMPLSAFVMFLWSFNIDVLLEVDKFSINWIIACISNLILSLSFLYLILFVVPFPYVKDASGISWFLKKTRPIKTPAPSLGEA